MANPRELAEQAFALLQSALRDSEARAADLDAQLKRKKAPKTKLEEQLDVLTHRLEIVEAERARWQREASHLEEVAEAERAKVAQLRKKLEVAESGPEKLTKKEVNFWRAKAEDIDTETKDYKTRLANLRREIIERDALIEKLREARHTEEAGANPGAPLAEDEGAALPAADASAELADLRRQLEEREQQLTEAHAARSALEADLARAQTERAELERSHREAHAGSERAHATLTERDHRIVELSAELERTRTELAQRREREHEIDNAAAQRGAELDRLRAAHADAERRIDALSAEVERLRSSLAQQEQSGRAAAESSQAAIAERDRRLAERDQQLGAMSAELDHARATIEASSRELTSLRDMLQGANRELDQLRNHKHRLEAELSDVLTRSDQAQTALARKDEEHRQLLEHRAVLERQRDDAREQISGLEAELKEEKDEAENLRALANERREALVKLQEQVEEANERYEEAKWRLGKAQYFERLVKRRKGLIVALLANIRAKSKANVALKAGLDGLRTYKASAEANQQKLLQRIDSLKAELDEAEETVARHQGSTIAKEQLADSQSRAADLETRLNTQAELIQSLEADLKTARAMQKSGDEKNQEIERLRKEVETKAEVVTQLQADVDEQQRKLAKLRGSESETMRLKALTDKDRSTIDALEREVAQLRETLMRQSAGRGTAGPSEHQAELEAKLKERESSVTRLMGTIKEHEATIKRLTDTAESWRRKYEFLATDAPDAYKTAAEK
jgi:chromosome segregation ATPase